MSVPLVRPSFFSLFVLVWVGIVAMRITRLVGRSWRVRALVRRYWLHHSPGISFDHEHAFKWNGTACAISSVNGSVFLDECDFRF